MTVQVRYEAVLEYDGEEELPANPEEVMRRLVMEEADFGEVTVKRGAEDETPVGGSVSKTRWVDDGTMLAWVEKDGRTWCETFTFETKEEVTTDE